jgi:hypothetical protein
MTVISSVASDGIDVGAQHHDKSTQINHSRFVSSRLTTVVCQRREAVFHRVEATELHD